MHDDLDTTYWWGKEILMKFIEENEKLSYGKINITVIAYKQPIKKRFRQWVESNRPKSSHKGKKLEFRKHTEK